jgi:tRNA threonylcarbamoyladenosine biosynthesis protein TsaB
MNILAFDTAFDACSVAAARGLRSLTPAICPLFEAMTIGHAERLMPMINAALSETKLTVADLDLIAVTIGPGTFTGTRITVAAARALALVNDTPIVTLTSLKLMAMSADARSSGARQLAIATDARRGEVYIERFCPRSLQSLALPAVLSIADAAHSLGPNSTALAGSGAAAVAAEALNQGLDAHATATGLLPDAFDMLFWALEQRPTAIVHPLYLRPPDAKPPAPSFVSRSSN